MKPLLPLPLGARSRLGLLALAPVLLCASWAIATPPAPASAAAPSPASGSASAPSALPIAASAPASTASAAPRPPQAASAPQPTGALAQCRPPDAAASGTNPNAGPDTKDCCCQGNSSALQLLDGNAYRLPAGTSGKAYQHQLSASGGRKPYRFSVIAGSLPDGLALQAGGAISGQAGAKATTRTFTVQLADADGQTVSQPYRLPIQAPGAPRAASASSAASAPAVAALTGLSMQAAQAPAPMQQYTTVRTYQLLPARLDELVLVVPAPPPETAASAAGGDAIAVVGGPPPQPAEAAVAAPPAPPAPAASAGPAALPPMPLPPTEDMTEAQVEQVKTLLKPLLGIDYPSKALFAAALDAQVCSYIKALLDEQAKQSSLAPPSPEQWAQACPSPRLAATPSNATKTAPHKSGSAAALPPAGTTQTTDTIPLAQLPQTVLPDALREWLIEAALQTHELDLSKPIQWVAKPGCGCVLDGLSGQVYGFYPAWLAQGKPQEIDFSVLTRISHFALPFDADGNLGTPDKWSDEHLDFIRTARRHGTALDLTIYRNDWTFLLSGTPASRTAMLDRLLLQVPSRAVQLINQPLPDIASSTKAWLPGFAQTQYFGDGITLYFDDLPSAATQPALRQAYNAFLRNFVQATINQLKKEKRSYTLNIVVPAQQFGAEGSYDVQSLFDYLKYAEEPEMQNGRIKARSAEYKSRTNVTVRFLVMLAEPTTRTKKELHSLIESSPALHGENRRIFMRRIVPVITYAKLPNQQLEDDFAYFEDNFGGIGFWPLPLIGAADDPAATADASLTAALVSSYTYGEANANAKAVGGWVCVHRWQLRSAFVLVAVLAALCSALVLINCTLRQRFIRFLPLLGVPVLGIGALLINFDPDLRALRDSGVLLWALVAGLALFALQTVLKPKVEKP